MLRTEGNKVRPKDAGLTTTEKLKQSLIEAFGKMARDDVPP